MGWNANGVRQGGLECVRLKSELGWDLQWGGEGKVGVGWGVVGTHSAIT